MRKSILRIGARRDAQGHVTARRGGTLGQRLCKMASILESGRSPGRELSPTDEAHRRPSNRGRSPASTISILLLLGLAGCQGPGGGRAVQRGQSGDLAQQSGLGGAGTLASSDGSQSQGNSGGSGGSSDSGQSSSSGGGEQDKAKKVPYLFPQIAKLFRDDLKTDSGASFGGGGGTTNPALPQPGPRRQNSPDSDTPPDDGQSRRSIQFPGPDLAGFPNSSFTLPKGRAYIETDPLAIYTASKLRNYRYNFEYLLRYGLTDDVELRIFSNGYTYELMHAAASGGSAGSLSTTKTKNSTNKPTPTTGFSPLAFDLKVHLWDENRDYFVPSAALECYIQTTFGSPAFNSGTQPSLALNFDSGLPGGFTLEYSVGISGNQSSQGTTYYQAAFQWSVQHNVVGNFDAYIHGYLNNTDLPRINFSQRSEDAVIGIGGIWTATDRFAIFGSYNFGLNPPASHSNVALLGFAYAL